ncbi:MAG: hypothetical protein Q9163_003841 [Psora crenata]
MRPARGLPMHLSSLLILLLIPSFTIAYTLDCSDIRLDRKYFNLEPLDDPHSLYRVSEEDGTLTNTTFTINVCRPLKKTKGVPKEEDCPNNSRVCAIQRVADDSTDETPKPRIIPIAGDFSLSTGGDLNPQWTRLKSSASSADREKEGLRLELNGGKYDGQKQKAIVEFLCLADGYQEDARRQQLSQAYDEEDKKHSSTGEEADDGHGGKLKFHSWEDEEKVKVLRLDWHTKYACENAKDPEYDSKSGHWGFFTWFIIIVFMSVAAYLVFGSWLNYNRYSARGWDLVPHSETIRDIPYLFRDWMRRVVSTVQGGGARGGYSAV